MSLKWEHHEPRINYVLVIWSEGCICEIVSHILVWTTRDVKQRWQRQLFIVLTFQAILISILFSIFSIYSTFHTFLGQFSENYIRGFQVNSVFWKVTVMWCTSNLLVAAGNIYQTRTWMGFKSKQQKNFWTLATSLFMWALYL